MRIALKSAPDCPICLQSLHRHTCVAGRYLTVIPRERPRLTGISSPVGESMGCCLLIVSVWCAVWNLAGIPGMEPSMPAIVVF